MQIFDIGPGDKIYTEEITLFGHEGFAEWDVGLGTTCLYFWINTEKGLRRYSSSLCHGQPYRKERDPLEYIAIAKKILAKEIVDLELESARPAEGEWREQDSRWEGGGLLEFFGFGESDLIARRPLLGVHSIPWEIPTPFHFILPIYFCEIVKERLDRKHLIPQSQTHLEQELIRRAKVIKETPAFKSFCEEQASLCGERWKKAVSDGADRYAEPNGILFPLDETTLDFIRRAIREDVLKQIKDGNLPHYLTEHDVNSRRPYAKPTGDLLRVLKQSGREDICGYLRSAIRYSMATVETPNEWWNLDI